MAKKRRTDWDKVQCVVLARVEGDAAALKKYGITVRTLNRYKQLAAEPSTDIGRLYGEFVEAVKRITFDQFDHTFSEWLHQQAELLSVQLKKLAGLSEDPNQEFIDALQIHLDNLDNHSDELKGYCLRVARDMEDRLALKVAKTLPIAGEA